MSLSQWLNDLNQRYQFIKQWTDAGHVDQVWFSGFFYPQAFLTGVQQNYARRNKIPIDQLTLDFVVYERPPEEALGLDQWLMTGLYLQGGALNKRMEITDATEQFCRVPYLKIEPVLKTELEKREAERVRYRCPVYRTTLRKGVLTTTGHSSNYIFDVLVDCEGASEAPDVRTKKEFTQKWTRRGAAMFQQKE